ncbi:uncharacterized protein LOC143360831 [Halictus rubicundus]
MASTSAQPTPGHSTSCTYCSKRGHMEAECWAKQRAQRCNTNVPMDHPRNGSAKSQKGKSEVNTCYSLPHRLTAIILRDLVVLECLIDSGATCSLVKESVARRADCKIEPKSVMIIGVGGAEMTSTGMTTAIVQTEDVTLEMDLLVVPDQNTPYAVIIGRNVLADGNLQMVTGEDGISKLQRCPTKEQGPAEKMRVNYTLPSTDGIEAQQLSTLLRRFESMMLSDGIATQKAKLKLFLKRTRL